MAPLQSHGRQNHMAPHRHLTPPRPPCMSLPSSAGNAISACHPITSVPVLPLAQRSTPIATLRIPSDSIHRDPQPASRRPWTAEACCRFPGASPLARPNPSTSPNTLLPTSPLRTSSRRLWTAVSHHSSLCARSAPTSPSPTRPGNAEVPLGPSPHKPPPNQRAAGSGLL
jgi:hypothetical protein